MIIHDHTVCMRNHAWVHFTSFSTLPFHLLLISTLYVYISDITRSNYTTRQNDAIDSHALFCIDTIYIHMWIEVISLKSDFERENRLEICKFTFAFFSFSVRYISCSRQKASDNETGWLDSIWNLLVNCMQIQEEREKIALSLFDIYE